MTTRDLKPGDKVKAIKRRNVFKPTTTRGMQIVTIGVDDVGVVTKNNGGPIYCTFRLLVDPGPNQFFIEHDSPFFYPDEEIAPLK